MLKKLNKTTDIKIQSQIDELITPEFTKSCYHVISRIPRGKVVTYQSIANLLGTKASQAVGSAMRKNPLAPTVPCHRVVNSCGRVGQYAYGQIEKIRLLREEGIEIKDGKIVDLTKYLFPLE